MSPRRFDPRTVQTRLAKIRELLDQLDELHRHHHPLFKEWLVQLAVERILTQIAAVPLALDGYRQYVIEVAKYLSTHNQLNS